MKEVKVYYSDSGQLFYDVDEAAINDKMAELRKAQAALYQKMQDLQDNCSHNHMTVSAHSDTGNYCRSDDAYWYDGTCRACGKTFREDQRTGGILDRRYAAIGRDPRVEKGK